MAGFFGSVKLWNFLLMIFCVVFVFVSGARLTLRNLQKMKSIQMVKKYRDRRGRSRVATRQTKTNEIHRFKDLKITNMSITNHHQEMACFQRGASNQFWSYVLRLERRIWGPRKFIHMVSAIMFLGGWCLIMTRNLVPPSQLVAEKGPLVFICVDL